MTQIKGKPFVYKGVTNVEECATARDVIEEAGLDFIVEKCPLFAAMPALQNNEGEKDVFVHDNIAYRQCNSAYATYRTDKNIPLGNVRSKYTVVQNIDAFNFFDGAIGKNKAIWQTAGCFGRGERIFVSAKLPKNILVNGDPVENYLVFTNSHDGTSGIRILFTPIRVVCQNTLNAAIKTSTNYVSFRHTDSVSKKLDTAAEILGISDRITNTIGEYYNKMNKMPINDNMANEIFAKTILSTKELENIKATGHNVHQIINRDWRAISDSEISMKKVNVISGIRNYYFTGPGQKEILGNAWGVYNAVTGYYSNEDNAEGEKRMDTLLYGDRANKIQNVGELIMKEYVF